MFTFLLASVWTKLEGNQDWNGNSESLINSQACEDARSSISDLLAALLSVVRMQGAGVTRSSWLHFPQLDAAQKDSLDSTSNKLFLMILDSDEAKLTNPWKKTSNIILHFRSTTIERLMNNCCVIVYLLGCSSTDWEVLHFRNLIIILFIFITNMRIENLM